jgi:hypothetical protein
MAKKKAETPVYAITLKIGGVEYHSLSSDVTEAILALEVPKVNSRAIFTLEYDGKKSQLPRRPVMTRMALKKHIYALYLGRNLIKLLK